MRNKRYINEAEFCVRYTLVIHGFVEEKRWHLLSSDVIKHERCITDVSPPCKDMSAVSSNLLARKMRPISKQKHKH